MKIFIIILIILLAVVLFDGIRILLLIRKTIALEKQILPFTRTIPNAQKRILILGDSTAFGTGVSDSKDSTAGRLGALYPEAEIVNLAVNGLRIKGLLEILSSIDKNDHYELILIQIGANDIIRFTSINEVKAGIEKVLTRSRDFKGKVILLHSGNIGHAKLFPWYLRPILSKRSMEVRALYQSASASYGAIYIDLIAAPTANLFIEKPDVYYANDKLHLTGEGYGLWFDEIKKYL